MQLMTSIWRLFLCDSKQDTLLNRDMNFDTDLMFFLSEVEQFYIIGKFSYNPHPRGSCEAALVATAGLQSVVPFLPSWSELGPLHRFSILVPSPKVLRCLKLKQLNGFCSTRDFIIPLTLTAITGRNKSFVLDSPCPIYYLTISYLVHRLHLNGDLHVLN